VTRFTTLTVRIERRHARGARPARWKCVRALRLRAAAAGVATRRLKRRLPAGRYRVIVLAQTSTGDRVRREVRRRIA
jgi:hypothetical protein